MPEASLAVESPEIEEVLDLVTGEHLPAATVIGDDYARAIQLRMQLRTGIRADDARYRWHKSVEAYKAAIKEGSQDYAPDSLHEALVALLFPELVS